MTTTGNFQLVFLEQVKKKLNSNVSFADELAETLSISHDSVYRRLRGETVLTFDEIKILCLRYGVSLDNLIAGSGDIVSFQYRSVDAEDYTFDKWLKSTIANLEALLPFPDRQIINLANNVPPAYFLNFPLLGPFKVFFWLTAVWKVENMKGVKFSPDLLSDELITLGKQFWKRYSETPRTEIWCDETINTTLHQIEFYNESGLLAETGYATQLCDEYLSLIREIRKWATSGYKDIPEHSFTLYENDLLLPEATILFKMGGKQLTILPCHTMNLLTTSDDMFCRKTEKFLSNVMAKSNLISTSGEKDRNKFFNLMEDKILQVRNRVK